MSKTRNSLPVSARQNAVRSLNVVVADLVDLFTRVKQTHWNVRGRTFIGLHKFLDEFADRILKRKEAPASRSGIQDWLNERAEVHAATSKTVRSFVKSTTAADDFGTADLLTKILRDLDLQLWLLESHLNQTQTTK